DSKSDEMRVIVSTDVAQIKIEVTPVARGTVNDVVEMPVVEKVEDEIGFAQMQVISMPDLYGGKICAALDRQHPRDLFDVKMLLESDGVTRDIFNGFIAYTLSHNRPIAEVMEPKWRDITDVFHKEFAGMTVNPVSLEALNKTKGDLLDALKQHFIQQDYDFLMSFKSGVPDCDLHR
ncbi:MAG: nucleotidyl transferase AbiEii/AbiGii toxin family protein, partial [Psychrosphaera sp.]|nr:nucleotidyl transferase AbiEii/AbiGii toxin family protein [Psychrosphaera sp.]